MFININARSVSKEESVIGVAAVLCRANGVHEDLPRAKEGRSESLLQQILV